MTLRALALIGIIAMTVVASAAPADHDIHDTIESIGLVLIFICIAGRTWCSFYIGSRKLHELVTTGPYSVSRNPLYVFSTIGAIGVGATFGSIACAAIAGGVVFGVFLRLARSEESALVEFHGEAFRHYCERVPRFWPRLSAWRDGETLTISQSAVYSTFFDSLFFIAAFPLAEGIEWLQQTGLLRPLLLLP